MIDKRKWTANLKFYEPYCRQSKIIPIPASKFYFRNHQEMPEKDLEQFLINTHISLKSEFLGDSRFRIFWQ